MSFANCPRRVVWLSGVFLFFIFFCTGLLVANRDIYVGSDTATYVDYYMRLDEYHDVTRFGFLFNELSYFFYKAGWGVELYFFTLFFIFNFLYFSVFSVLSRDIKLFSKWFVFSGVSFFSSWYLVATINGLRQGLSLPFLYIGLYFFSEKKYLAFLFFVFCAFGFHSSSMLALPFFIFVFFNQASVFFVFCLMAMLYCSGIAEHFVFFISDVLSIDLYNRIAEYSASSDRWVGFQIDFFVYTVFWGGGLYWLKRYVKEKYLYSYVRVWKIYCILMLPYFFFGFGAFSNRYAFIGWLYLPVVQAMFLISSDLNAEIKLLISLMFFAFGVLLYVLFVSGVRFF